jgi:hypothetical protein
LKPKFAGNNVQAYCPDCQAVTTFEYQSRNTHYGQVICNGQHWFENVIYDQIVYWLLRCAGCGRGGLSKVHFKEGGKFAMEWFHPTIAPTYPLPAGLPAGVQAEFREAETCANAGAWRAATAMLRSTLEKLLKANGYTKGDLKSKIDEAAAEKIITEARKQRAHEDIRVLGNDILHDEWREVSQEEYELAHRYAQRIAEDLYDDRATVEKMLQSLKRLAPSLV